MATKEFGPVSSFGPNDEIKIYGRYDDTINALNGVRCVNTSAFPALIHAERTDGSQAVDHVCPANTPEPGEITPISTQQARRFNLSVTVNPETGLARIDGFVLTARWPA